MSDEGWVISLLVLLIFIIIFTDHSRQIEIQQFQVKTTPIISQTSQKPVTVKKLKKCPIVSKMKEISTNPRNITIDFDNTSALEEINEKYASIFKNQTYFPHHCDSKLVGIVIPYRNRESILRIFLPLLIDILIKQKVAFRIFIVEQIQNTVFNRGKLLNVGFDLMQKNEWDGIKFSCIIMHDVDLILADETISYQCNTMFPVDLASKVHPVKWSENFKTLKNYTSHLKDPKRCLNKSFGGVSMMEIGFFRKVNGFSNLYFGWGGEDDDLRKRIQAYDQRNVLELRSKHNEINWVMIGQETNKTAEKNEVNNKRYELLETAEQRMYEDGLKNLQYEIVEKKPLEIASWFKVDIGG